MNLPFVVLVLSSMILVGAIVDAAEPAKYLRYRKDNEVAYGRLEGDRVRKLDGDLFGKWTATEVTYELSEVQLLPPTKPSKVMALAGNYRSHLDDDADSQTRSIPQPFFKSPSCLIGHGDSIVIPKDAKTVHYEAELVIVIGTKCTKVSRAEAPKYIFGVTNGNDVSERIWQNDEEVKDVQWWRAKATDTFGPVGPFIATGVNYGKLNLRLRLNGKVKQEENTDHLIHDIPSIVSFISQYVTLNPGDMIFTGTPGKTSDIKAGDVVEVELEGVGVLRNPVVDAE